MRLWSIHPQYLDRAGLVACWREALLAKKVLQGKTKGYTRHPQLTRFRNLPQPLRAINTYLYYLWQEAKRRGYLFHQDKIGRYDLSIRLPVTDGQITYEWEHLLNKLKKRSTLLYRQRLKVKQYSVHPLFEIVAGEVESWEKQDSDPLSSAS